MLKIPGCLSKSKKGSREAGKQGSREAGKQGRVFISAEASKKHLDECPYASLHPKLLFCELNQRISFVLPEQALDFS
jgi:hypothetical protein